MKRRLIFLLTGLLVQLAFAQNLDPNLDLKRDIGEQPQPNDLAALTLHIENDLVAGTDRYYTSGVKLTYLSPDRTREELGSVRAYLADTLGFLDKPSYLYNVGWSFGQSIFTPEDTETTRLESNDRPYAGWLYLAGSLHHKSERDVHILELTLGIVGPESQGENAQNAVHHHRGLKEANGWDHQLGTEPGLILSYDYRWRVMSEQLMGSWLETDLLHTVGLSAGNVLTELNSGLTLRLGLNLPADFQSVRIRQTGYARPPMDAASLGPYSIYIFSGVMAHAVARDIFLDGNTFTDSHSVDRIPFYGESVVGIGLMLWRVRLTYTHIFTSEQFREQDGGQQVGSFSVTVAF